MAVYHRRAGLSLLGLALGLLAGCIQPVEEQPGATPTVPGAPESAAVAPPAATPALSSGEPESPPLVAEVDPAALVTGFIQRRGDQPANVAIWADQRLEPDQLQAFTYTGAAGQPCAGFLVSAVQGAASDNGAVACADDPAAGAFAGVTLFLTSDGQPHSIVFGQVFDPTIAAVAAIYADGTSAQTQPVQGGFAIVTPGIAEVSAITAIDPTGSTVIPSIPQSAVR